MSNGGTAHQIIKRRFYNYAALYNLCAAPQLLIANYSLLILFVKRL